MFDMLGYTGPTWLEGAFKWQGMSTKPTLSISKTRIVPVNIDTHEVASILNSFVVSYGGPAGFSDLRVILNAQRILAAAKAIP